MIEGFWLCVGCESFIYCLFSLSDKFPVCHMFNVEDHVSAEHKFTWELLRVVWKVDLMANAVALRIPFQGSSSSR
jgi:hypothetical protein